MKRCSFCEWIPILPWPVWPLAGQFPLGQNVVVGSMTLLLAVRGKHCHEKYVWTPVGFTTAPYHGLVWSYRCQHRARLSSLHHGENRGIAPMARLLALRVRPHVLLSYPCGTVIVASGAVEPDGVESHKSMS